MVSNIKFKTLTQFNAQWSNINDFPQFSNINVWCHLRNDDNLSINDIWFACDTRQTWIFMLNGLMYTLYYIFQFEFWYYSMSSLNNCSLHICFFFSCWLVIVFVSCPCCAVINLSFTHKCSWAEEMDSSFSTVARPMSLARLPELSSKKSTNNCIHKTEIIWTKLEQWKTFRKIGWMQIVNGKDRCQALLTFPFYRPTVL